MIPRRTNLLLRRLVSRSYLTSRHDSKYSVRFQKDFKHAYTFGFIEPEQTRTSQTIYDGKEAEDAHRTFSVTRGIYRMLYYPSNFIL